ncbi:insulinase family protein [Alphaproteobacteria bacterium]|nr:insulinase family protein [Alphaproteobacteria bacterium]
MSTSRLTRLANGLAVATRAMPHTQTISIGIWVQVGARDERDNEQGIAHMLEHMAFKGTSNRDALAIATEVEDVGGFMNAHTSREETAYYIRILPEHLDLGIDILADILTCSTLPEDEIERERGVIIQEIGQSVDTPDDMVFDLFAEATHGGHTLGRPILGTVDSVSAFAQHDLAGFMKRHYGAEQMLVCAAGKIDHDDLVTRISNAIGSIKTAEHASRNSPSWQAGRKLLTRDLEQSHVIFGLPAPSATTPDRFALMALSTLYGGGMSSRLFQQVREKRGLCYSIFSFPTLYSDCGVFGVYAGTSADKVDEMLRVSAGELAAIATKVTDEEVARAKAQIRANLLMSRESVMACGDALARQITLFGAPQDDADLLDAIDAITATGVSQVAAELIAAGDPAVALVGPTDNIMSNSQLHNALSA